MVGLEKMWWRQETSDCTWIDMMRLGDKQSGMKKHGEGRRQEIALRLTWWDWETSSQAQIDTVEEGDKQSDAMEMSSCV